jgi:hypothetical protein|tara:strand:- start:338 stop:793 length:456 start_codon:yes stop_codon:yes gene_type:complete
MILESVMACNMAFGVVKKAIENGKEIHDCAKAMGAWLGHKEKIEEEVKKSGGSKATDLQLFYELEKIKKDEIHLKYLMNKSRLGMWSEYQQFVMKRKTDRNNAAKAAIKAQAKRDSEWAETIDQMRTALFIVISLGGVALLSLYMIYNFER